jgi:hypothetical protein
MFCLNLTVSRNSRKFDSATTEAPPSGENIFHRKPDPDFLLAFCRHFASISNLFRVIYDFYSLFNTSQVTDMLDDVTDRK